MHSMMGGHYPSGGITLGPAMTFGYLAAHHAAGRPTQPKQGHPMYYELATLTLPFGTTAQAAQNVQAYTSDAAAGGELLGCWYSDIGQLNQLLILRGFDSLAALEAEQQRTRLSADPYGCGSLATSIDRQAYQAPVDGPAAPQQRKRHYRPGV
jgi:hypothetical protein